jgi:DNA-binding GntR family transcriptional regulator
MPPIKLVKNLREQIAGQLRDDIIAGRLPEGSPLRESELSKKYGVSRGPIREALQELAHEGLLIAQANRGMRVAPAPPDSIRDLVVPIRRTIETYALRLFFDGINEDDFAVWEEILRRLKTACQNRNYAAIAEEDIALHRSCLNRSGRPELLAIWSVLVSPVRRHFEKNYLTYNDPMEIYTEHRVLIDTFRQGDLEAAVKELEKNIA